uniref:Uncharacterized protein n=1 Tax=Glossina palpalis gambiensis TaxID=67801 RepID=A0A1B0BX91_9MUSC
MQTINSFAPINLQAVGESHIKLKLVANKHIKIMLQNHEFYSSIYAYSKVPNDSLHAKCNFLRVKLDLEGFKITRK